MKLRPIAIALIVLAANSAFAARVTNLDHVPHVVTFERAGSVAEYPVQPQRTVYLPTADGVLGLKGGNPGTTTFQADGLFSGVIGSGRSSRIPASPGDNYTIWPGGKIYLQSRTKNQKDN